MTQYHIIQNWLWLGAVNSLEEATTLIRTPAGFDHDGYKILCKPLLPVTMKLLNLIRRMTSEPVDFTEQQFTLRL
ncbi:excinuclease Cho [Escherichia coli]|nr:excinuclease Cho [Escherichia coli]